MGNKNYSSTVTYDPILQLLRLEINLDMGDALGKYSQELLASEKSCEAGIINSHENYGTEAQGHRASNRDPCIKYVLIFTLQ